MKRKICVIAIAASIGFISCKKDKAEEPSNYTCDETISFSGELQPELFNVSCNVSGCHTPEDAASGYVWDSYANISPHTEKILGAIEHDGAYTPMPLGGDQLADSLIQKFACWVEQGALDN